MGADVGWASGNAAAGPSISLIVPTFNRGDLIAETLDSALAQTCPFAEIIVVDNGSTDDTTRVLAGYGPAIRAVRTANIGVQAARNVGAEMARADCIVFCDSDDLLEPELVSAYLTALRRCPGIDAMYCNFVTFDAGSVGADKFSQAPRGWFSGGAEVGDVVWQIPELYIRSVRFQPLFPTGMLLRRAFFAQLGGFDTRFRGVGAEDWEFTLRVLSAGQVALHKVVLTRLRRHAGNDSKNTAHMSSGEAAILEFGLRTHPAAAAHRAEIRASIAQRRLAAFDSAFAQGDLALASDVVRGHRAAVRGIKRRLKAGLLGLPAPLRQAAWRWTQPAAAHPECPARIALLQGTQLAPGASALAACALAAAYPAAHIHVVMRPGDWVAWRNGLPSDVAGRVRCADAPGDAPGLDTLPAVATWGAHLLVFLCPSAAQLDDARAQGLARRSVAWVAPPDARHRQAGPAAAAFKRFQRAGGRVLPEGPMPGSALHDPAAAVALRHALGPLPGAAGAS